MKREHTSRVKSSASNLALHGWPKNVALYWRKKRVVCLYYGFLRQSGPHI